MLLISFLYVQYIGIQETSICLMSCKRITNMNYYITTVYGKETATDLENEALFLKVQDFIIHSKRFDKFTQRSLYIRATVI